MTTSDERRRRRSPRVGYVVAVLVNAILLYLVNVAPGWEAVPFLTPQMTELLPLLDLALIVGAVSNLVYVVWDPPRLRALGDLVGAVVALVLGLRTYQVFPFDFSTLSYDLTTLARIVVVLGIVGAAAAILGALVALVRGGRGR
jgi:hypothetical protein